MTDAPATSSQTKGTLLYLYEHEGRYLHNNENGLEDYGFHNVTELRRQGWRVLEAPTLNSEQAQNFLKDEQIDGIVIYADHWAMDKYYAAREAHPSMPIVLQGQYPDGLIDKQEIEQQGNALYMNERDGYNSYTRDVSMGSRMSDFFTAKLEERSRLAQQQEQQQDKGTKAAI